jgi:ketoreductase RED1
VTIVGANVIGISWARVFGAAGWEVRVSDPRPDLQDLVDEHLGDGGFPVAAVRELAAAAEDADYVQEAGPDRLPAKEQVFAALAEHTRAGVVLASSGALAPSQIAQRNPAADRIVAGHPFNPLELMPLVEVVPGPETSERTVLRAVEVYRSLGKVPIALKKEFPGFVGGRLQKVLDDQATYLVQQGVVDVKDLDDLVRASVGLRWATVGPFQGKVLGGGPGGIRHLLAHAGAQLSFEPGEPDPGRGMEVVEQVERAYGVGMQAHRHLVELRDARTRAVLRPLGWPYPAPTGHGAGH